MDFISDYTRWAKVNTTLLKRGRRRRQRTSQSGVRKDKLLLPWKMVRGPPQSRRKERKKKRKQNKTHRKKERMKKKRKLILLYRLPKEELFN